MPPTEQPTDSLPALWPAQVTVTWDGSATAVAGVHAVAAPAVADATDDAVPTHGAAVEPPQAASRRAPLLLVLPGPVARVVVGRVEITVDGGAVGMAAVVDAVHESMAGPVPEESKAAVLAEIGRILAQVVRRTPGDPLVVPGQADQAHAASLAKAVAELSRDSVGAVRELRYSIEETLAGHLGPGATGTLQELLAELVRLRVVGGRARDHARDAVRGGLDLWLTDEEAYQAYRRSQDPAILNPHAPADASTRPWMRTHDAAVRQCRAMDDQLGEEVQTIAGLLDAAATIASARESESQQAFNTLLSAGALGLGLPALLIALYSADRLVPVASGAQALAMIPIVIAALVAAGLAGHHARAGTMRKRVAVGLAVAGFLLLLVTAALVAPPTTA